MLVVIELGDGLADGGLIEELFLVDQAGHEILPLEPAMQICYILEYHLLCILSTIYHNKRPMGDFDHLKVRQLRDPNFLGLCRGQVEGELTHSLFIQHYWLLA